MLHLRSQMDLEAPRNVNPTHQPRYCTMATVLQLLCRLSKPYCRKDLACSCLPQPLIRPLALMVTRPGECSKKCLANVSIIRSI